MQKNDNINSEKQTSQKISQGPKNLNEAYEELKGCSAEELMGRLAKEINLQKSNGTFDYDAIKNSIEQIKMYLPNQTYENMLRIIENLR